MDASRGLARVRVLEVLREAAGRWAIRGTFADGASLVLARVGEGSADPRDEEALRATAECLASTLRLLHRRAEVEELGIGGRVGHASVDFDPGAPDARAAYRAVVLQQGRRTLRFASGDPGRDWSEMKDRARSLAEILLRAPSVDDFAARFPGWELDGETDLVEASGSGNPQGLPVD